LKEGEQKMVTKAQALQRAQLELVEAAPAEASKRTDKKAASRK
jgi:hypothetical protein